MKVISLQEVMRVDRQPASWQSKITETTFPKTLTELDSLQHEKYLFGQILTRIVAQLAPLQPLIVFNRTVKESDYLLHQENLCCRANLLRLITLRFLSKEHTERPPYAYLQLWPSSWDEKFMLSFMNRFYDRMNSLETKSQGYQNTPNYTTYKKNAEQFEPLICPTVEWVDSSIIGENAVKVICEEVWKQELKHQQYNESRVKKHIHKKPRLLGILGQLKNRQANGFDNRNTFTAAGNLSEEYMSFWRNKFPMLVTATYLIAIRCKLYRDDSFKEFFGAKIEFYESFANMDCNGQPMPMIEPPAIKPNYEPRANKSNRARRQN